MGAYAHIDGLWRRLGLITRLRLAVTRVGLWRLLGVVSTTGGSCKAGQWWGCRQRVAQTRGRWVVLLLSGVVVLVGHDGMRKRLAGG